MVVFLASFYSVMFAASSAGLEETSGPDFGEVQRCQI